jgi:predicted AlkP superfamily pyrophosphatase or phosphodiesterase
MVHYDLLHQIIAERKKGPFVYPYYGKYSIAEIEPTIRGLFGIPTSRQAFPQTFLEGKPRRLVILLIIDGLGFNHLLDHGTGSPFFDSLMKNGDVYPITSVFPSTTPAALTTIHTGYTPQEHGLVEWFTYFEEFQKVIMPMQFRASWDEEVNILAKQGGTAHMLYEREVLYETLGQAGVTSNVFIYHEYMPSMYSDAVQRGSNIIGYREGRELMHLLHDSVEKSKGPSFFHIHWGQVDKAGHEHGPNSPQHRDSVKAISNLLHYQFLSDLDRTVAEDVTFILTADHGQIPVTHDNITYLEDFDFVWDNLQTNNRGEPIMPTGSANDVLLYIKPDKLSEVIERLKEELKDIAWVFKIDEAVAQGLFGLNHPVPRFWKRAGNVLILPFPHQQVWFAPGGKREYHQRGMHGGLSQEEMIVPFAVAKLSDLMNN